MKRGFIQSLTLPLRLFVYDIIAQLSTFRVKVTKQYTRGTRLRTTSKFSTGFTIIELLVVLAIIGMLASIISVAMSGIQAKSRDTRRLEDLREFQKALSLYYVDNNEFPATASPITLGGSDAITTALVSANAISGFEGDPVSPTFDYIYEITNGAAYTITFCLETNSIPRYAKGCSNTITP